MAHRFSESQQASCWRFIRAMNARYGLPGNFVHERDETGNFCTFPQWYDYTFQVTKEYFPEWEHLDQYNEFLYNKLTSAFDRLATNEDFGYDCDDIEVFKWSTSSDANFGRIKLLIGFWALEIYNDFHS